MKGMMRTEVKPLQSTIGKTVLANRAVGIQLIALVLMLLLPLLFDSRSTLILLSQVYIFGVFAMSYDILLGYTGIISFGHAMFFGIGAYTTGIMMKQTDNTLLILFAAICIAAFLAFLVSFLIGILSLRLKATFYAMITLAFAELFFILAEKWRRLTFGNDGFTFSIPKGLSDRLTFYYVACIFLALMFLFLKRFIDSPVGKVLVAVRENEQRTESLGFKVLHYKVIANIVAGVAASLAGVMYALSIKFVNTSVFTVDKTVDALLMTIVGGVGTLFGPLLGSVIIQYAHESLTELAKTHWIFERWLILFGIIYILIVMFFPKGIVGTIREKWIVWRDK